MGIAEGGTGNSSTISAHNFFGNNTSGALAPAFDLIGTADTTPNWYAADTGVADAAAVALNPAPAAPLPAGLEVDFLPAAANATTTPTLNVSGLGAKTITKSGGALAAGDLTTAAIAKVIYDGTNWELQNPQTAISGSGNYIQNQSTTAQSASFDIRAAGPLAAA